MGPDNAWQFRGFVPIAQVLSRFAKWFRLLGISAPDRLNGDESCEVQGCAGRIEVAENHCDRAEDRIRR
jgi:hypothetical protein